MINTALPRIYNKNLEQRIIYKHWRVFGTKANHKLSVYIKVGGRFHPANN